MSETINRTFSIRTKITAIILTAITLLLLTIFITSFLLMRSDLEESYRSDRANVERAIVNSIKLIDTSYVMVEKFYETSLAKAFARFNLAYEKAGRDPAKIDLESLKKEIGGGMDLYIINSQGVIEYGTVSAAVGLDLKNFSSSFFERYSRMLKGDRIVIDRISPDLRTGEMKIWAYMPTRDQKYTLEFGLTSKKTADIISSMDLNLIAQGLVEEIPILDSINIYFQDGRMYGNSDFEADEKFKQKLARAKREGSFTDEKGLFRYLYVDLDTPGKPSNMSKLLEIKYDRTALDTRIFYSILIYFFATLFIIITFGLLIFFLMMRITKPIEKLNDISNSLADGDLTRSITVNSRDEIGLMAGYFNNFIKSLNGIIRNIMGSVSRAKMVSDELALSSSNSSLSLEKMKGNMGVVKEKTDILDSELENSLQYVNEVKDYIDSVNSIILKQSAAIGSSSQSLDRMSDSIRNVTALSEEKIASADNLEKTALEGQEEMKKSVDVIRKVARSADLILEMIKVIKNIANSTNLLAMNAAIEAAHAGEAGRGFAVVADEIRTLAEGTTNNSREISDSLKEVIENIHISEDSIERSGEIFSTMVEEIKAVARSMEEIKNDMQKLSSGSGEVTGSLERVVSINENVKSASGEVTQRVTGITASLSNINEISSIVKGGMKELNTGINDIFELNRRVAQIGEKNVENVSLINSSLSHFKVGEED